ncbi:hypothetical protein D3C85_609730 [compost metagenome]
MKLEASAHDGYAISQEGGRERIAFLARVIFAVELEADGAPQGLIGAWQSLY